jgi:hypothetical protein
MKLSNCLFCLFFLSSVTSCKKTEIKSSPIASLNVVTAVINGGNVKLNTNLQDSAKAYNSKSFAIIPGSKIVLYPTNNPLTPYYNPTHQTSTENGEVYSVFLAGQAPTFESVFVKENLPERYADSTIGVRIINLSPNSTPINVTLASANTINVFSDVSYKQISDFAKFPLRTVIPTGSATFQIRDAAGTLLATYTIPTSVNSLYPGITIALQRFKNITLVIKGLMGTTGSDGFGVFPTLMTY